MSDEYLMELWKRTMEKLKTKQMYCCTVPSCPDIEVFDTMRVDQKAFCWYLMTEAVKIREEDICSDCKDADEIEYEIFEGRGLWNGDCENCYCPECGHHMMVDSELWG